MFLKESNSDAVPNTSPTAASSGSDINGLAIQVPVYRFFHGREIYQFTCLISKTFRMLARKLMRILNL